MSSDDELAQLAEIMGILRIQFYIQFGVTALVAYEYFLTFYDEVKSIWRRKITGASVLFIINRYVLITTIVLQILPLNSQLSCSVLLRILEACAIIMLAVFALFSALRVYAMWDRNWYLFTFVFLLGLVPVATNFFGAIVFKPLALGPPINTCVVDDPVPPEIDARIVRATRLSVIAADFIVLILTWAKTYGLAREAARLKMQVSVTMLLLRDGTSYFVILLAINIADMVTATTDHAYISPFVTNLTPLLIARFMLNLRQLNDAPGEPSDVGRGGFSAPAFVVPTSVTGNLGESLADDLLFSQSSDSIDSSGESYSMGPSRTSDCETPQTGVPEASQEHKDAGSV